jgi:hypothetical protein
VKQTTNTAEGTCKLRFGFEKKNNINKPLTTLRKKKRQDSNKIIKEKGNITQRCKLEANKEKAPTHWSGQ